MRRAMVSGSVRTPLALDQLIERLTQLRARHPEQGPVTSLLSSPCPNRAVVHRGPVVWVGVGSGGVVPGWVRRSGQMDCSKSKTRRSRWRCWALTRTRRTLLTCSLPHCGSHSPVCARDRREASRTACTSASMSAASPS